MTFLNELNKRNIYLLRKKSVTFSCILQCPWLCVNMFRVWSTCILREYLTRVKLSISSPVNFHTSRMCGCIVSTGGISDGLNISSCEKKNRTRSNLPRIRTKSHTHRSDTKSSTQTRTELRRKSKYRYWHASSFEYYSRVNKKHLSRKTLWFFPVF